MTKQKDTKERIDSILLKAGVERNEIEATREQILAKVCNVIKTRDYPQYKNFVVQCGERPADIAYACGARDEREATLKELGA